MTRVTALPDAALLADDAGEVALVVSDVHIGFEAAMARRGVRMDPKESALEMAHAISDMARKHSASRIVLLGDTKAGTSRIERAEWDAVPEFLNVISDAAHVTIIPGNHDAGIAHLAGSRTEISSRTGLVLGDTLFTHGHTMPSANFSRVSRIVMGHAHPILRDESSVMGAQRMWVTMRVDKDTIFESTNGTLEITVMPTFNRYIVPHSVPKNRNAGSPILARARNSVVSAKVLTLDSVIIGDESMLGDVL